MTDNTDEVVCQGAGVDPDPMPKFVLLAKDYLSVGIIHEYLETCIRYKLHKQAEEVRAAIAEFYAWRARNHHLVKFPDHKHVPATENQRS